MISHHLQSHTPIAIKIVLNQGPNYFVGFNEVLKPAWTKRTSFLISVSKALPSIFAFLSASKISTNAKRGKEKIEEKKKSLREREERQKKSQFITRPGPGLPFLSSSRTFPAQFGLV